MSRVKTRLSGAHQLVLDVALPLVHDLEYELSAFQTCPFASPGNSLFLLFAVTQGDG